MKYVAGALMSQWGRYAWRVARVLGQRNADRGLGLIWHSYTDPDYSRRIFCLYLTLGWWTWRLFVMWKERE